jgi:putative ABC transport system permease protein
MPGPLADGPPIDYLVRSHEIQFSPQSVRGVSAFALVLAAGVALASVALSINQRRYDDTLLALQGSSPRWRRRMSALETGVITAIGAVLAAVLGSLTFWTYTSRLPRDPTLAAAPPVAVPWAALTFLVLVVPLATALLAYGLAPPLRRLDVSRLTDDD